jgi:hypothetical protein
MKPDLLLGVSTTQVPSPRGSKSENPQVWSLCRGKLSGVGYERIALRCVWSTENLKDRYVLFPVLFHQLRVLTS